MTFQDFIKQNKCAAEEPEQQAQEHAVEEPKTTEQTEVSPGGAPKLDSDTPTNQVSDDLPDKDKKLVMDLLNKALADEFLAWYQYWVCYNMSRGPGKFDADPQYEEHAKEELEHAQWVMDRIKQLGGKPYTSPDQWLPNANPWPEVTETDVKVQIDKTIEAENTAIKFYTMACEAVRHIDFTTYTLFKKILIEEEEHAYDMNMLKEAV